jgi:hypothetical protein
MMTGKLSFIVQPLSSQLLTSELPGFQLSCLASNVHPQRPVLWVKVKNISGADAVFTYVDNGRPPSGNYLNLDLVSPFFGVRNKSEKAKLQGYYRCEVWEADDIARGRIASNTALVTFKGCFFLLSSDLRNPFCLHVGCHHQSQLITKIVLSIVLLTFL